VSGSVVVRGISQLVTNARECDALAGEDRLGIVEDAAVVVESTGEVAWVGRASEAPAADAAVDLGGRSVVPGFVDSHTHLAYAGDRAAEFAARMTGERYDGGGIHNTVSATRAASSTDLVDLMHSRLSEMRAQGTWYAEIKSGYGLTVEDEARLVELASSMTYDVTFLGAHVVPAGFPGGREAYVDLVTGPMLAACAPYSRWIDVFCEPGSPHAFDGDEARRVLLAGRDAGLGLRVHGNQLGPGPGVQIAVELDAAAVDHCTFLDDADVAALAGSDTVATLLPGVEFSTRMPYVDARRLLDSGATVALATDLNPGTCNTSSMPFVIALAVREMGMTPAEALWSATAGGARALRREDVGRVEVGRNAWLTVLDAPTHLHLSYRPGVPLARALDLP
jgi:imidazolonepropionase